MSAAVYVTGLSGGCVGIEKWNDMERRDIELSRRPPGAQKLHEWLKQLDDLRGDTLLIQSIIVDHRVDLKIKYADDRKNFGAEDYWATPQEAIEKESGDCEDFAILKYAALLYLGVDEDRLRLMTVSKSLFSLDHAVLIVDARSDDVRESYPLDSALRDQKNLSGIYRLENDGYGSLKELKDSGYYGCGIMNKKTKINLVHNPLRPQY